MHACTHALSKHTMHSAAGTALSASVMVNLEAAFQQCIDSCSCCGGFVRLLKPPDERC
jgi:hypothetical protein